MVLAITGALAGLVFGYVLARSNMCFHSAWRGLYERRYALAKAWALSIAIGTVGLALVFSFGPWNGLNRGLPFRPVDNIVGGIVFGIGLVVAATCASGLFYKLGSGMLGAAFGLVFWAFGEWVVVEWVSLPGPTVLRVGEDATLYGWLGISRWFLVIPIAVLIVTGLARSWRRAETNLPWWSWPAAGVALGVVLVVSWILAGAGDASFGASTVGAVSSFVAGDPNWWLIAFLAALIPGALAFAAFARTGWIRGEDAVRYLQLAAGGFLIGAGARLAGGCNLGHGMSGLSQLSIASIVTVPCMVAGVGAAWLVVRRIRAEPADWRPRVAPVSAG